MLKIRIVLEDILNKVVYYMKQSIMSFNFECLMFTALIYKL